MSAKPADFASRAASVAIFPLAMLALIFSAHAILPWHITPCRFFEWTGIPCPGCGAMRCLDAIARLRFAEALRWNPLALLLMLAAFLQPLLARDSRIVCACASRAGAWTMGALVLANWIYLCLVLPG